eukprot:9770192-Alexandrium_andersonii.AAC.1
MIPTSTLGSQWRCSSTGSGVGAGVPSCAANALRSLSGAVPTTCLTYSIAGASDPSGRPCSL